MKEHPIIFSTPMVRAISAGTKTQTRRVIDVRDRVGYPHTEIVAATPDGFTTSGGLQFSWRCPYGMPGDRLWVRETWSIAGNGPFFRADVEQPETVRYAWKPGIHMPRWASRITLEVTDVRAQRLQDISEEDAKAEGGEPGETGTNWTDGTRNFGGAYAKNYRSMFPMLWDSVNGKRAPWESNPWVRAITFKVLPRG